MSASSLDLQLLYLDNPFPTIDIMPNQLEISNRIVKIARENFEIFLPTVFELGIRK